ncbi:MAG: hypothetical protein ACI934_000255 [Pseudohongiellaceae bacterium]|jgi:hypothetical protein
MTIYPDKRTRRSSTSSAYSQRSFFASALPLALLTFVYLQLLPNASAQDADAFPFLLFEPVLIETTSDGDLLQINELTSLLSSSAAESVSEYITKRTAQETAQAASLEVTTIAAYEQSIKQLELQGGAYEPGLSQALLSLANVYQGQNDHIKALEYLDQALHINRVNSGLFNLEQERIIEGKISSHIALGELNDADVQQQYLFYLKRKAFGEDSIELLPALNRYAEWNIYAFDSTLVTNPTLDLTSAPNTHPANALNNTSLEEDFRNTRLVNAQFIYRTIIKILLNNYGSSDSRLLDVEKKLALTNYFFATNLNMNSNGNFSTQALNSSQEFYNMSRVSTNSLGFRQGREALERRLDLLLRLNTSTPEDIAKARIEFGDWLLIFKKRAAAIETYQFAYDELLAKGVEQETIDKIFSPDLPATIPTFIYYRYTRDSLNIPADLPIKHQGWFDVLIQLNRYGQPQNIEIFNRSPDAAESVEFLLSSFLRNSTSFRPRFADGELIQRETIETRYYYSY